MVEKAEEKLEEQYKMKDWEEEEEYSEWDEEELDRFARKQLRSKIQEKRRKAGYR